MVGGVPGGRSTYGVCFGALSWLIDEGRAGDLVLSGLAAAFLIRYDDDEPGSPWTLTVHVDERGSDEQRAALAGILLGEAGGDDILRLPWVRKPRDVVGIRASAIRIDHADDGYRLRVGELVDLVATAPVADQEPVRCGIPGYNQAGTELVTDVFEAHDDLFDWHLEGNCAFASHFDYSS
jgi:hypothetical protein